MTTDVVDDRVPVIDLEGRPSVPSPEVVRRFGAACEEVGFVVVTGHALDQAVLDQALLVSREFFRRPAEEKESYLSPSGSQYRGWRPGSRHHHGSHNDLRERFQAGRYENAEAMLADGYPEDLAKLAEDNVWPSEAFEEAWQAYMVDVADLGNYILEVAALALELPQTWFADKFGRQTSTLLANYYPARSELAEAGTWRLHAHTDAGAFTVLYQDTDAAGLEVECRDGVWTRVPVVVGAYIINLGDMFANWTNNRWVATRHRVRNPETSELGQDRMSLPFFQDPNLDALIETIPTCLAPGEAPSFEPVLWRDWKEYRM